MINTTQEEDVAFGHRLATVRTRARLTQSEFASSLDLGLSMYDRLERGEREAAVALAQ